MAHLPRHAILDNLKLYPRPKECPYCLYNINRYQLLRGINPDIFIPKCPNCNVDLLGY